MSDITVALYSADQKSIWDQFVANSHNGHFMHFRDFMEYHADRFVDNSLMFYRSNKLIGILPANISNGSLFSHQGLTFGGLIVGAKSAGTDLVSMVAALGDWAKEVGVNHIRVQPMPTRFCKVPREDQHYALFQAGWQISRRDLSTIIDYSHPIPYRSYKKRSIKKAQSENLLWEEAANGDEYWPLLEGVIRENHNTNPVHSLEEINLLKEKFPKHIRFIHIRNAERLLGGTVLFLNGGVVHTQYLAVNEEGRKCGALDVLLDTLINEYCETHSVFSFGISTTEGGTVLNESLLFHKEAFGGRGLVHDFYERSF